MRSAATIAFVLGPLLACAPVGCSLLTDWDALSSGGSDGGQTSFRESDGGDGSDGSNGVDARVGSDAGSAGDAEAGSLVVPAIEEDDFERVVAEGFGNAKHGRFWNVRNPAGESAGFSVDGHRGAMKVSTGGGDAYFASLADLTRDDIGLGLSFTTDRMPSGGYAWLVMFPRLVDTQSYACNAIIGANSEVFLSVSKKGAAGVETIISDRGPLFLVTPGTMLRVRCEAFGVSPTTLRAKIWAEGGPEPAEWQTSTSDAEPALQKPGAVGFIAGVDPSVTNLPIAFSVDDVLVRQGSLL